MSYSPELEWRIAAKEFGYTWREFCSLPGAEQSEIIAAFRVDRQVNAVVQYEETKASSRKK